MLTKYSAEAVAMRDTWGVIYLWTFHPATWVGWTLMALGAALMVYALVIIIRDLRRRAFGGWDLAAITFVLVGGPGAALAFVAAHDFLQLRARREAGNSERRRAASQ